MLPEQINSKITTPVIALGTFDGLHPGHRAVLGECIALAREKQVPSMVYTFIENPRSLFGQNPRALMSPEDKTLAMREMGITTVEAVHFTCELSELTPAQFVDMLERAYSPCAFVCGADYSFGRRAAGTSETLRLLAKERGIETRVVPLVRVRDSGGAQAEKVSSTLIRRALDEGDTQTAERLLKGDAV